MKYFFAVDTLAIVRVEASTAGVSLTVGEVSSTKGTNASSNMRQLSQKYANVAFKYMHVLLHTGCNCAQCVKALLYKVKWCFCSLCC